MNCVPIACVLILIQGVFTLGDPQFEIRDGNCSKAIVGDIVFQKNIHLMKIPFVTREDTESWHGDYKIYCILALSAKEPEKGSTVNITEGGVGHNFVSFKFKSSKGHGLDYMLSVYANTTSQL